METLKELKIGNIAVWNIIVVLGILLISFLLGKLLKAILQKISKRYSLEEQRLQASLIAAFSKSITLFLLALGFSIGTKFIPVSESFATSLSITSSIIFVVVVAYFLYNLIEIPSIWLEQKMDGSERKMNKMFIPVIRKTLRVTVVILSIIQIIQILSDKPITSIIAGLGIGGLAVALAAQDTLKNFFGSLALMGDKPFNIGDRIVIDSFDGVVEQVGLRSTRLRTLDGHVVTFPNGDLANKAIKNISERPNIKRTANITITYDTPQEKIKEAVEILRDLLKDHEGMDPELPPRVYFNEFNDTSLNILMIYWFHPAAYWEYMEFTEKLNHKIFVEFEKAGIEFAFPTQTLFVAGDPKRPFKS